jgi:hypothetical protein
MNSSLANARIRLAAGVLAAAGLFISSSDLVGQSTGANAATSSPSAKNDIKPIALSSGVEILTDTQGVDFGPYIKKAVGINIDRSAWGAITAVGQFPPLPAEFKGSHLELRINFRTNRPFPSSPPPAIPYASPPPAIP